MGWAPAGPLGAASLIGSWADFARLYGGLDSRSDLGYAVSHFFANGGTQAYVVRVATPQVGGVLAPASLSTDAPGAFEAAVLPGSAGGVDLLEQVDGFNMLCVPGEADAATLLSLAAFCRKHRAMLIADCYQDASLASLSNGPPQVESSGDAAANMAFYFPWILAPDPLRGALPRLFPPCGFLAGVWARTDSSAGVWKVPAGSAATLIGASEPGVSLGSAEVDILDSQGINCIRNVGHEVVVWGARTLQGNDQAQPEWKYISVRRLTIFIESSLLEGLQWAVFEPNDEPLWAQIRLVGNAFMQSLFRQGAFEGETSQEAYFLRCDATTTSQADIDQGIVNIVVGFAPLQPAEFVIFTIGQFAGRK